MVGLGIKKPIDILRQLEKPCMRQGISLKNQRKRDDLQYYENNLETKPDYESEEILHCSSCYLIRNGKRCMFFSAIPVPRATQCKGSSATWNGIFILSDKRLSSPFSKAPPPAR